MQMEYIIMLISSLIEVRENVLNRIWSQPHYKLNVEIAATLRLKMALEHGPMLIHTR